MTMPPTLTDLTGDTQCIVFQFGHGIDFLALAQANHQLRLDVQTWRRSLLLRWPIVRKDEQLMLRLRRGIELTEREASEVHCVASCPLKS